MRRCTSRIQALVAVNIGYCRADGIGHAQTRASGEELGFKGCICGYRCHTSTEIATADVRIARMKCSIGMPDERQFLTSDPDYREF